MPILIANLRRLLIAPTLPYLTIHGELIAICRVNEHLQKRGWDYNVTAQSAFSTKCFCASEGHVDYSGKVSSKAENVASMQNAAIF